MKNKGLASLVWLFLVVFVTTWPVSVFAAHEECEMCHRDKDPENGDPYKFAVQSNNKDINFRTGKPLSGSSAICMGCHTESSQSEDIGPPINLDTTHPVGIVAKKINVPGEALDFFKESENISCLSCHDQHPDNKNYKLLRWPSDNGEDIAKFCVRCHVEQGYSDSGAHADCSLCHDVHQGQKEVLFKEIPNTTTQNPRTGKLKRMSSLCLACHAEEPDGAGFMPIDLKMSHPVGIKAKKVKLPEASKGFKGEEENITCMGCHDPHPRNKNYKYLRWKVKGTYYLNTMCQQCHVEEGNPKGTGPHGQCALCHGNHSGQGPYMLTEMINNTTINPHTGKPFSRIGQICLACHAAEPDGTGYKVINLKNSHPLGVKPKKATLPRESTGFPDQDGRLVCVSCHDQHPRNTNYKYLRWPVKTKKDILAFCLRCHPNYEKQLSEKMKNVDPTRIGVHFNQFRSLEGYMEYLDTIKR